MSGALRVVVADDHGPTREVVREALEAEGCEVVADVGSASAALAAAHEHAPDVCLLDINMPGSGLLATADITRDLPGTAVVMLTASRDDEDLFAALRAGASGYLVKDMDPSRIAAALRGVLAGEAALPRWLVRRVVDELRSAPARVAPLRARRSPSQLTPREQEILDLMAEGLTTDQIARRLFVAQVTVRTHISTVLRKLRVPDRAAAVRLAQEVRER
ncbi:response regulator [Aquipuribacter nitratireducens]|uniref:Response regulator n=1 Tax=Aquipuribacter nitratireducens TaxID=650104 RepID=A0ABW0GUN3_9MICO